MKQSVLFLDIDGVLNGHDYNPLATLHPHCVQWLNYVIDRMDCLIVLSSAWRYMVLGGSITMTGFEYLLRTHGVHAKGRLFGCTPRGEESGDDTATELDETKTTCVRGRSKLIRLWAEDNLAGRTWSAIDDLCLDLPVPYVQTNGSIGMTGGDALELVRMLKQRTL